MAVEFYEKIYNNWKPTTLFKAEIDILAQKENTL
jgi:hypothetical protein